MSINLIPFKSSAEVNGSFQLKEIIKSIIIFMPFGIYICMIKNKWNILKKVAPIFFTSLALEAAQFIFPIGAADITDLIGNTIGGILGIGVYVIFTKLYKERANDIVNFFASNLRHLQPSITKITYITKITGEAFYSSSILEISLHISSKEFMIS